MDRRILPASPRAFLAFACALCVFLRLPSFHYQVISDDEAIYDAMARVVTSGGVMYRDVVDHKPPGLTYTYSLTRWVGDLLDPGSPGAHAMDLLHLVGILAVVLTCVGLYPVGRRLLRPGLAGLPPLLYALVSAAKQPSDSLAVNGELMMNLPTIVSVGAVLAAERQVGVRRALLHLLAGALCGVAVLYKYQAGLFGLAFPFLIDPLGPVGPSAPDAGPHEKQETKRTLARWFAMLLPRGACWLCGLLLPLLLCAACFHHRGVLNEALRWGIGFNRRYLQEGPGLPWAVRRFAYQLVGVVLPGIVVYGGGLLTFTRLLRGGAGVGVVAGRSFLLCWTGLSLLAVGLGGRFFGHYFLQPELPLSLLAAGPIAQMWHQRPRLLVLAVAVPGVFFFLGASFPSVSRPIFSPHDPDFAAIGRAIAARTRPTDTIWVWGNVPQIYSAADRSPGVRFTFCNYLTGLSPGTPSEYDPDVDPQRFAVPWAWPQVFEDLERHRPALLVDTAAAHLKFYGRFPISHYPDLDRYLAAHYRRESEVASVVLYRRCELD